MGFLPPLFSHHFFSPKHPDQPTNVVWGQARTGAGDVRAWGGEKYLGPVAVALTCQRLSPLFLSLLLGVPLLFVIPWGIVKYLYEDEG